MNLYLIRHGETAWSISGQHTGRTDLPLTARGEQDSRTLAEGLRAVRFSRVFTSPRQRARRTCELAGLDAAMELEPDLAEWDYGDYEGQRSAEIRNDRPDWNLFRDGCPHGESPVDVSDRADRLIASASRAAGEYCGLLARAFRPRPGRAVDWITCQPGAAFRSQHGVRQHPELRAPFDGRVRHRVVERFTVSLR
jgi:broad specificity phosphatase PhoE